MERKCLTWIKENKDVFVGLLVVGLVIAAIVALDWFLKSGGIGGAIDKWYEKDRAKCVEKAPVYGMTGQFYPYWDEDEHECLMITQDSIYRRLDERSIRRRLEE